MYSPLYFQIASLFYTVLIMVIFFNKKKVNNIENRVFTALIISNFIGILLDLVNTYQAIFGPKNIFLNVVSKIYLVYLLTWIVLFSFYTFVISFCNGNSNKFSETKHYIITKIIYIVLYVAFAIVLLTLPLYNNTSDGVIYTYGPGATLSYLVGTIFTIISFFIIIMKRKQIKKTKYIPLLIYILLSLFIVFIQKNNPEILIVTAVESFVNYLIYFTLENPDLTLIEQLNIAKDQADKANNAKTEFLSSMSHEIRTPLNAIVGFSNSLNENPKLPETVKNDVKDILTASDNLLEIVNGVLDISKIEANKIEIVENEYDTKKLFDDLSKLTKVRIGEKPIKFEEKINESVPRVLYGDHIRVKQVILNLLTNAAKYTDEGKIVFSVNSVKKDNIVRLIVSVEDTGRGIKEENINKLFTKFERLDEERNTTIEGTGLGLAITKKLVDLMKGTIVVQSKFGKGSKFTVSIDQGFVKKPTLQLDKEVVTTEELNIKGKKVLVVDDNKLNIKVAERLLSAYKLDITSLYSGEETLETLKKNNKYDLILLDDMMPKLSGVETLNKIKEDKLYEGPIVVLTANALTGMRDKYINLGFDDYLAKPIETIELNRILKKYLKK